MQQKMMRKNAMIVDIGLHSVLSVTKINRMYSCTCTVCYISVLNAVMRSVTAVVTLSSPLSLQGDQPVLNLTLWASRFSV